MSTNTDEHELSLEEFEFVDISRTPKLKKAHGIPSRCTAPLSRSRGVYDGVWWSLPDPRLIMQPAYAWLLLLIYTLPPSLQFSLTTKNSLPQTSLQPFLPQTSFANLALTTDLPYHRSHYSPPSPQTSLQTSFYHRPFLSQDCIANLPYHRPSRHLIEDLPHHRPHCWRTLLQTFLITDNITDLTPDLS